MRRVYCDANATTPLLPEVMEAMRPYWMEQFGNASSIHFQGQKARAAVDHARETLARFFHCREAEVVFNSGGTEGDNTAIFGLLRPGDQFITTSIEHSAVLRAADRMAEQGWADRSRRDSARDQARYAAGRFPQDPGQRDAGK
jgi:cysteine desulfurase